jgi:hypothetical protein
MNEAIPIAENFARIGLREGDGRELAAREKSEPPPE